MSVPDDDLPPHWKYYADRADEAHRGRADDYGQGREEQLDETLRLIEKGKRFTKNRMARLDRLPHNRSKKYTRLRLYTFQHPVVSYEDDHETLIDRVHAALSPAQWEVECRLVAGESYAALAGGVTVASLKMKVSRWRAAIREKITA
jgi:hypothetical protein